MSTAFDLARLRRLLTAVGLEGDAASMAGSLHAKMEELAVRLGVEGDAASMAGSLHAKMESIFALPAQFPQVTKLDQFRAFVSATAGGVSGYSSAGYVNPTFGSWVEVTSAAPSALTVLAVTGKNTTGYYFKVQVGMGGAGSEVVIGETDFHPPTNYSVWATPIDLLVPAPVTNGSRLAVRVSASTASQILTDIDLLYVT